MQKIVDNAKYVIESMLSAIQTVIYGPSAISDKGLQFIADYENFFSSPYDDGFGNQTIGYGHVIGKNESFTYISKEGALDLLKQDVSYWEKEVWKASRIRNVVWSQSEYDAFVSLAYNSGYYFIDVMDAIIAGANPHAAFSKIINANGQPVLGLYRRRMDEADIFLSGTYKRTYRGWT